MARNRLSDPNCRLCGGEGHLYADPDSIVPVMGRTCECVKRALGLAQVVHRLEELDLPDRYTDADFERFWTDNPRMISVIDADKNEPVEVRQSDVDRANLARVRELAATPLVGETIAFTGPFGVGKTYLAACLLRQQVRDHDKTGLYTTAYDYIRRLLPEGSTPEQQRDLRRRAKEVDILLLDDLGVEKASRFAMSELWGLLNERTTNARTTIVTSNMQIREALLAARETKSMTPEAREAAEIGQRIWSRLVEARVPPIVWPEGSYDVRMTGEGAATKGVADRRVRTEIRRDRVEGGVFEEGAK